MNILNKLTKNSLKLNHKRTLVTCIGIILSTALICAVAGMVTSFQQTLIVATKKTEGNYHVRFENVLKDDLTYIEKNDKVKSYFLTNNIGYSEVKSKNDNKPYVYVIGFSNDALNNMGLTLEEGKFPSNNNEIVIPSHLINNGEVNLKIGDKLTLKYGIRTLDGKELNQSNSYDDEEIFTENGITKTYTIVGIIDRPNFEQYNAAGYTLITYMDDNYISANISILYKNAFRDYKKTTKLICGNTDTCKYKKVLNSELLRYEGATANENSLNILYSLAAIIITIIVVSSIFVIKNSFSISITERIKQYGMLRSVGATKKQIKKNVLYEGLILGLISIPLGIIVGILAVLILIWLVNYILKDMLNGMNFVYSVPIYAILISIVVSALTIYLSTIFTARKAAKISPIEAIRSNDDIKIKSKKLKTPKLIDKLFGIGGTISYKNLKRNRKKYRTTVISLVVSIAIFIGLSSFIDYGFNASYDYYKKLNYDYSFFGGTIDSYNKILSLDNIKNYTLSRNITITLDGDYLSDLAKSGNAYYFDNSDNLNIVSLTSLGNKEYTEYLKKLKLSNIPVNSLIVFDGNYSYTDNNKVKHVGNYFNFKEGDTINVKDKNGNSYKLNVIKITEETPMGYEYSDGLGGPLFISDALMDTFDKDEVTLGGLYIKTDNYDEFSKNFKELQKNDSVIKSINYEDVKEYASQMNAMVLVISIFLYGFILVITLIGVTNIFNTITTNMNLRSKEFATLKSIGMTSKEFNRMIRLESIFYGSKSLLFGIPIGLFISYLISKAFAQDTLDMAFIWPWKAIIISIIFVFLIVSLTMHYSLTKINKQNIIETIRNDNI